MCQKLLSIENPHVGIHAVPKVEETISVIKGYNCNLHFYEVVCMWVGSRQKRDASTLHMAKGIEREREASFGRRIINSKNKPSSTDNNPPWKYYTEIEILQYWSIYRYNFSTLKLKINWIFFLLNKDFLLAHTCTSSHSFNRVYKHLLLIQVNQCWYIYNVHSRGIWRFLDVYLC